MEVTGHGGYKLYPVWAAARHAAAWQSGQSGAEGSTVLWETIVGG